MSTGTASDVDFASLLAEFGLGPLQDVQKLGGTAARKWRVTTPAGRYVVRVRPAEFADAGSIGFDHAVLRRLAAANLPVPRLSSTSRGETLLWRDGSAIEVLSWVEGDPYPADDPRAAYQLGVFLACFHGAVGNDFPPGKAEKPREDQPDAIQPYLTDLLSRATGAEQRRQFEAIGRELQRIREDLDGRLYPTLPRAVIHGDIHPGNVRFRGHDVAAVYDFDYLAVQARVRDVIDALAFFASTRSTPFETDDIRSLTQPFVPDFELSRAVLSGYQAVHPLTGAEWQALPLLIRSRWSQIRLRGSRKVPQAEKADFVLNRFFELTDWLDHSAPEFFERLRQASLGSINSVNPE